MNGDWAGPARRKLSRAKEHHQELDTKVRSFVDSHPYYVTPKVDVQGSFYEEVVHYRGDPSLPGDFGLIIGDIANNLRSCLNYLAYDLTIRKTNLDPPPNEERIQFPIVKTGNPNDWGSQRGQFIPHIGTDVANAIESVQPYHRLKDPDPDRRRIEFHPLWCLNDLNNADKHRVIPVAAAGIGSSQMHISFIGCEGIFDPPGGDPYFGDFAFPRDGSETRLELEEGAVAVRQRLRIDAPNPEVRVNEQNLRCSIRLRWGPFGNGPAPLMTAVPWVRHIIEYIENDVFDVIARAVRS